MSEARAKVASLTPWDGPGSVEEGMDLLNACCRQKRVPTTNEIVDWKRGRGSFGSWSRREQQRWVSWAVKVVQALVMDGELYQFMGERRAA